MLVTRIWILIHFNTFWSSFLGSRDIFCYIWNIERLLSKWYVQHWPPPPSTTTTTTTRLWSSQGHYFPTPPHLCLGQEFFLYVFAKIWAPICHCGVEQKTLKELFQRIRNRHFRSTRLIGLSSSASGKCSIILLEWFAVSKNRSETRFKLMQFHPKLMYFDKKKKPHRRLAFHKLEHPFIIFAITCEARLHCEPQLFNSGIVVSIKIHHIYGPFFLPQRLKAMSLSSLSSCFHLCLWDCVGTAVVFI